MKNIIIKFCCVADVGEAIEVEGIKFFCNDVTVTLVLVSSVMNNVNVCVMLYYQTQCFVINENYVYIYFLINNWYINNASLYN